jgi:hypothetical protein
MSEPTDDQQFSKADLESPAYRQRLMRKLNCLIAVLEVACAKVRRSLDGPGADIERLERIKKNLTETLEVCRKAKNALERRERLPDNLPVQLQEVANFQMEDGGQRPFELRARRGAMVEMTSADEFQRFQQRGPIGRDEVRTIDFDALARALQG